MVHVGKVWPSLLIAAALWVGCESGEGAGAADTVASDSSEVSGEVSAIDDVAPDADVFAEVPSDDDPRPETVADVAEPERDLAATDEVTADADPETDTSDARDTEATADAGPDPSVLGPEHCPQLPPDAVRGTLAGQPIVDLTFLDCAGDEVSLSDLCGAAGVWLFLPHAWCTVCQSVAEVAETIQDEFAADGLVTVNVVVESANFNPPTASDCAQWRERFGLEDVITLYDPNGVSEVLWDYDFTALSVFLDANQVIFEKTHAGDPDHLRGLVRDTLGLPW